jgi:hypothetical protein
MNGTSLGLRQRLFVGNCEMTVSALSGSSVYSKRRFGRRDHTNRSFGHTSFSFGLHIRILICGNHQVSLLYETFPEGAQSRLDLGSCHFIFALQRRAPQLEVVGMLIEIYPSAVNVTRQLRKNSITHCMHQRCNSRGHHSTFARSVHW